MVRALRVVLSAVLLAVVVLQANPAAAEGRQYNVRWYSNFDSSGRWYLFDYRTDMCAQTQDFYLWMKVNFGTVTNDSAFVKTIELHYHISGSPYARWNTVVDVQDQYNTYSYTPGGEMWNNEVHIVHANRWFYDRGAGISIESWDSINGGSACRIVTILWADILPA